MRIVYDSSGNFAAQIMNGAHFHLLLPPTKNGKTVDAGLVYAIGKLVLIANTPSGSRQLNSKAEIVKPELAPYGRSI